MQLLECRELLRSGIPSLYMNNYVSKVMLFNIMLCYVMLCHVMLRYVTLRYVTLRYVTLRYVTLRYVTLRYVMLCYVSSLSHVGLFSGRLHQVCYAYF